MKCLKNLLILIISTHFLSAQNSYTAKISSRDHYNSRGAKLTKIIDILRQDRANFYKSMGDDEDTALGLFNTLKARNKMNRYTVQPIGMPYRKLKNLILSSNPLLNIKVKNRTLFVSIEDKSYIENYFLTKEEKKSLLLQILNRKFIKKDPIANGNIKPIIRDYLENVKYRNGLIYTYVNKCKKIGVYIFECEFGQGDSDGEDESYVSIIYKAIKIDHRVMFDSIDKYFHAD